MVRRTSLVLQTLAHTTAQLALWPITDPQTVRTCLAVTASCLLRRDAEEDDQCSVESHHVVICQATDVRAETGARRRHHLVDHKA